MIPKRIFSIWFNESPELPELVQRCLPSHELPGYEHVLLTLRNVRCDSSFFREALEAKRWVKCADYCRMYYLYKYGGIYCDADLQLLKPLDDLLDNKMFVWQEENQIFSNAFVGSEAGRPLLKEYLRRLDENFKGGGDLTFEPGVRAFADLIWTRHYDEGLKIIPSEQSYMKHFFLNSWVI